MDSQNFDSNKSNNQSNVNDQQLGQKSDGSVHKEGTNIMENAGAAGESRPCASGRKNKVQDGRKKVTRKWDTEQKRNQRNSRYSANQSTVRTKRIYNRGKNTNSKDMQEQDKSLNSYEETHNVLNTLETDINTMDEICCNRIISKQKETELGEAHGLDKIKKPFISRKKELENLYCNDTAKEENTTECSEQRKHSEHNCDEIDEEQTVAKAYEQVSCARDATAIPSNNNVIAVYREESDKRIEAKVSLKKDPVLLDQGIPNHSNVHIPNISLNLNQFSVYNFGAIRIEDLSSICKSFIKSGEPYYISKSQIHGYGLFAKQNIEKGSYVIEYIGEYIGKCVSDKREKMYRKNGINSIYMFAISRNLIIDSTLKGNAARYINHSCNPNCRGIVKKSIHQVHYTASRDISKDEELTIDYNVSMGDCDEKLECNCGYELCLKRYG